MTESYFKVWEIARKELYSFIKLYNISKINYTFEEYFNHIVQKHKIKLLPHHFSDEAILGLTLIDNLGISFSYEISSIPSRQNFTKCHELGHLILQHSGTVFAENTQNNDQQEKEANYFSSFILMPDIVLLTKIFYQKKTFQETKLELKVSTQAFELRLNELLINQGDIPPSTAQKLVTGYITGSNKPIMKIFASLKDKIISEYESIYIDDIDRFKILINTKGFLTQLDITSLSDLEFQKTAQALQNIEVKTYYNQGLAVFYSWHKDFCTEEESLRKAKLIHYELIKKRTNC